MSAETALLFPPIEKPYLVLLEPASGRAAAYDAQNRLLTDRASERLVAFALERHVHSEYWDDLKDLGMPRQRPSWAPGDNLSGCTLYWLRNGWSKFRDLLDTPDA
ncbi:MULTISPECIES: hypothetical protein [Methylibium]|jgi:hypothetical protein|uniref:hypothetical protein n=1 Tax=Methylibium TaxID=316612 RepID=UPI001AD38DB1|nr:hypothetical protein [Methylibium petroleiphilum]MBN9205581.1 hypothetical protein [Methylibium petroleiphilum]